MDDVRAVMDTVGSSSAALLGMSEGGAISAMFAATYPQRVTALVLLGVAIRCWVPPEIDFDDPGVVAYIDEHFGDGSSIDSGAPSVADDPGVRAWAGRVERLGMTPTSLRTLLKMNTSFDTSVRVAAGFCSDVGDSPTLVTRRSRSTRVAKPHSSFPARDMWSYRALIICRTSTGRRQPWVSSRSS